MCDLYLIRSDPVRSTPVRSTNRIVLWVVRALRVVWFSAFSSESEGPDSHSDFAPQKKSAAGGGAASAADYAKATIEKARPENPLPLRSSLYQELSSDQPRVMC